MSFDGYRIAREQLPLPKPYVAPRTSTEQRLAAIWQTVLSMDRVGVDDNYHDLGGDSFLAAVIFARIEDEFGVAIPMATLMTASTIADLAIRIEGLSATVRP